MANDYIWKDPRVNDALKDGRQPDDIAVLECPQCGKFGYYNQGSHFSCLGCDMDFYVCSESEEAPDRPFVRVDDFRTLADITDDGGGEP